MNVEIEVTSKEFDNKKFSETIGALIAAGAMVIKIVFTDKKEIMEIVTRHHEEDETHYLLRDKELMKRVRENHASHPFSESELDALSKDLLKGKKVKITANA